MRSATSGKQTKKESEKPLHQKNSVSKSRKNEIKKETKNQTTFTVYKKESKRGVTMSPLCDEVVLPTLIASFCRKPTLQFNQLEIERKADNLE